MKPGYFEQAHQDERRRAEWKSLDEALIERTGSVAREGASLRITLGHLLIQAGSKLAGEQAQAEGRGQARNKQ
ncbi:hypothetical protein AVDCRST_MAG94-2697 [uncultured Leptolyngbya sp.]|uniref:Uncharacterized protein n=1 Tax=uncultured Leptolyngbya sp. TaxID=332963 RepID=A0A6J4M3I3_9CYAN|nr:hypothetical protein AVDCRST_MAG94-2697 [uncultured Leptolyngbya sp.]